MKNQGAIAYKSNPILEILNIPLIDKICLQINPNKWM